MSQIDMWIFIYFFIYLILCRRSDLTLCGTPAREQFYLADYVTFLLKIFVLQAAVFISEFVVASFLTSNHLGGKI